MTKKGVRVKNIIPIRMFVYLTFISIIGSGCGTSGMAGSLRVQADNGSSETRIIIDNPFLASKLKISDLEATFSGNLLVAHVAVKSTHNSALQVQYKFRWYDAQGLEIGPDASPWQPLMIYGGESKGLQSVAPNPSVKEFKIEIRYTK